MTDKDSIHSDFKGEPTRKWYRSSLLPQERARVKDFMASCTLIDILETSTHAGFDEVIKLVTQDLSAKYGNWQFLKKSNPLFSCKRVNSLKRLVARELGVDLSKLTPLHKAVFSS